MQQTQSYAQTQYMSQTQVQRSQEISTTNISSQQQVQQQQFAATNINYQQQQQLQKQQLQQQQQQYTAATNLNLQQQQQQLTSQPFIFSDGVATTTSNMAYRAIQENDVDTTGASKALKPNFVKIPGDKEVTEGKMVRFDLRVSGRPFPDVSWYLNGNQLVDDATHKLLVNEGGVHALMITSTSRTDAGTYTCVARNKSGEATFTVNLHVIGKFSNFVILNIYCM